MNKKLILLTSLLFWPYQIFAFNNFHNFSIYSLPIVFLFLSYYLHRKGSHFFLLPTLLIPFVEPKLATFPLLFMLFYLIKHKINRCIVLCIFTAVIALFFNWPSFTGQTIFHLDYERKQEIIRNTKLYNNIFLARTFHNKPRIVIDKFNDRFTALIDPNNYFFGFAPRQISENQNIVKYPFVALLFFFYGIYRIQNLKQKDIVILSLISGLISLSILTVFDKNDLILWLPISIIIIHGINELFAKHHKKERNIFSLLFWAFSIPEIITILVK